MIAQLAGTMKRYMPSLGRLLVLGIFILAIGLLYRELRSYSVQDIRVSLHRIPARQIGLSLLLMVLNYAVLVGYDGLALMAIRKKLGVMRVCMVSFVGSVISYNFGALLGGSTVRYRLYSAWGFTALDIVRLVLMLAVTFWVGAMGLAGGIFLIAPFDVPPELGLDRDHVRLLGAILTGLCVSYHALCAWARGRAIRVFGREFALPSLPIAMAQTLVASLDLVVAASCLYTLLPQSCGVSFAQFLPGYLLAQVTAVLTHIPGGMGVLEVILLNLTHGIPAQQVFAAVLTFRVIYYLLPLMLTAVLLGAYEIHLRHRAGTDEKNALAQEDTTNSFDASASREGNPAKKKPEQVGPSPDAARWFRAWLPTLLAYAVFLTGALLCMTTVLPFSPSHNDALRAHFPLWMLEGAHIMVGLAGVLLMALAFGLEVRKRVAWRMVVAALLFGIAGCIGRGGYWAEALLPLALLFPLIAARRSFGRIAPIWRGVYPVQWAIAVGLVMLCVTLLGLALVGLPTDGHILLHMDHNAGGPRILRALAAELAFLAGLTAWYLRAPKRR